MTPVKPTYDKVALMIYGNPQSAAGYQSIFYINDPRFTPPADLSPGGMNQNDHYFVVNISQAFTNIVLIQNNVKSAGASREGILKFAMAVPKGYRLADGKTPYDFLMDVRSVFLANYMEPYGNGWQYKFPLPAPNIIQSTVDKYSYVPAALPHRQMNGQAQGMLVTNQISALFSDLQYPEFGRFREIVIGEHSTVPTNVGNIAIPRRPAWRLKVNGMMQQWPGNVRDIHSEPINISAMPSNPRHYEPAAVTFTIAEARKGSYPEVTVDEANEVVNVRLDHKPRRRTIRIRMEGDTLPPSDFRDLTFRVAGKVTNVADDMQIVLSGPDIDRPVSVDYTGKDYSMRYSLAGDVLTVNMKRRQLNRPNRGYNADNIGTDRRQDFGNRHTPNYDAPLPAKGSPLQEFFRNPIASIALIAVAFLIGIVVGFFIHKYVANKDKDPQETTVNVDEEDVVADEWWTQQRNFENMNDNLQSMGLLFATVEGYGKKISELEESNSESAQKAREEHADLIAQVKEYTKAVNAIRSANVDALKTAKLNPVHQVLIEQAFVGWYDPDLEHPELNSRHNYTAEAQGKAKARFVQKAPEMESFIDFINLHEGLQEYVERARTTTPPVTTPPATPAKKEKKAATPATPNTSKPAKPAKPAAGGVNTGIE